MPVERYSGKVPRMLDLWKEPGTFRAQTNIWDAQSSTRHEMNQYPTAELLAEIKQGLILTREDIQYLIAAGGHETNNLLRLVQGKMSREAGNDVHRRNTSSDILDTALAVQTVEGLEILDEGFGELQESVGTLALKHRRTLQVARTHGQHAIPWAAGRQMVSWYEEIGRGRERFTESKKIIAVGKLSGEVGTHVYSTPEFEERALAKLGLTADPAPTQIISRDRHSQVIANNAINAGTLERVANDIWHLSMTGINEMQEPFDEKEQQGSSSMPQKRNPEKCERVMGLARIVRSMAIAQLEAQAPRLQRDISHSSTERYTFPESFVNLAYMTLIMHEVIRGLVVNEDQMFENLKETRGGIYGSRLLNTLLDTGQLSRTEAYDLIKGLAMRAYKEKVQLMDLALDNSQLTEILGKENIPALFDPDFYLRNIDVAYRRVGLIK